jgi:hypothetical protein
MKFSRKGAKTQRRGGILTRFMPIFAPLRLCVSLAVFAGLICAGSITAVESAPGGALAGKPPVAPEVQESLRRVCQYLWSQQADDGGWHSGQYAVLRSGQALTPFVLHTLLQVPEDVCPRPDGGVERALEFIRQHVDDRAALGHADPDVLEYPVYSTAYALRCLVDADRPEDHELAKRMRDFLESAQFQESNGFDRENVAYGGWGFDAPLRPGEPGHMDLAHTRRVLEALADFQRSKVEAMMCSIRYPVAEERSENFLRVVQRHPDAIARQPHSHGVDGSELPTPYDGGFYFSPVVLAANKGREEVDDGMPFFRSYATATCDGVLALLAAGVSRDDERVVRAARWLKEHGELDHPEGVPIDHPEPWGEAIRFYHYSARAEAYAALDWPGTWREELAAAIAKKQAVDGSFRNTASPLMKEDDPILCSTLAAIAMIHCLN